MATCADSNCGYYYKKEGEEYPHCQYPDDGTLAPCEYNDYCEPEDIDDDFGFDPYGGCFCDDL